MNKYVYSVKVRLNQTVDLGGVAGVTHGCTVVVEEWLFVKDHSFAAVGMRAVTPGGEEYENFSIEDGTREMHPNWIHWDARSKAFR